MTLRLEPEGLAAAGAALAAVTTWLATGHVASLPVLTGAVSTAANPVLRGIATVLGAWDDERAAIATNAIEELGRSGVGVAESGVSYAVGDAVAASTYVGWGGL
ncbi:PE family protein [Mycobacterium decipiens]|uniref:PE domain-containing protein n=1 Tax=Mycobacterium decipiens TaxID=1430326 RepID=A0A1X2LVF2_9MYCO|nr:PE family protein [Mycobacterium decipiens]OSC41056.1 hypothetical protein B8W66_09890 [Mycobacterium decipiens]